MSTKYDNNIFSQHNIRVTVQVDPRTGETVVWNAIPGEEYGGDLLGIIRSLDRNNNSKVELDCQKQPHDDLHCTYGVIFRRGYAVVDDTYRPQFDNDTQWPWIINKKYSQPDPSLCQAPSSCFYSSQAQQDLYLFRHGHDYAQALYKFTRLAGSIPFPSRCTFGVFFSHYWAYAEYEERQIVTEYIQHDVLMDVLVTDVD